MKIVASAKEHFFDRQAVQKMADAEARRGLARMGAYIRRVARNSIKVKGMARRPPKGTKAFDRWLEEVRNRPRSAPGSPVFQHADHPVVYPRNIWYAWDGKDSVVVGMAAFGSKRRASAPVPHQIEFGSQGLMPNARRTKRHLGGVGEIRIGGKTSRASKQAANTRIGSVLVTYAALRNAAMVDRANRLNAELYGPDQVPANTAARPVMAPAFSAGVGKFDEAFSGRLIEG